jgi:hypothetical protein
MIAWGRYTFLLVAFVIELMALIVAWRLIRGSMWLRVGIPLVVAIALIVVWLVIRPTTSADATSAADAKRLIGDGTPTVLEFYSEY